MKTEKGKGKGKRQSKGLTHAKQSSGSIGKKHRHGQHSQQGKKHTGVRKNAIVNQYLKNLKKEKHQQLAANSRVEKIYNDAGDSVHRPKHKFNKKESLKIPTFHKEEKKWKFKQAEKERMQQVESAKKEALVQYHKKKQEKHRKLAKRNYKGQPNMASQMDLLLQKIQNIS